MIAVTDEISTLRNQELQVALDLDSIRGLKGKAAECRQLDKKLASLSKRRAALEAVARFEIGMPVNRARSVDGGSFPRQTSADYTVLGIITEKRITPGDHPEVWVSWDGKTPVPEQPTLLEPDSVAIASIVQPGDEIVIGNGHLNAGQVFTVERLQARGWVATTDGSLFPPEYWQLAEEAKPLTQLEAPATVAEELVTDEVAAEVDESDTVEVVEPESVAKLPAVEAAVEVVDSLTPDEECDRISLELEVDSAFRKAIGALKQLHDRKLYRSTHKTWEAYCKDRFGYGRIAAHYKIAAAVVVENLLTIGEQNNLLTNGAQILPTSERQVRPLTALEPDEQRSCWQAAVEKAGGKVPSGQIVKRIVDALNEKPARIAPADFCEVGDVFILVGLKEEQRHYNGCWAIAVGLNSFTVEVETHQETLLVKPDNLKLIDDPQTQRMLPSTLKRIRRLRQFDLSNCAHSVLETLGHQTYLTDKEEQMLQFLEQQYGIVTHPPVMPGALAAALPNLTPGQLQEVVKTAVTNGLDDNQLKALIKAGKQALNRRHHPDYVDSRSEEKCC